MARQALATIVLTIGLVGGACGDDGRPKISEWQAQWESTRELVPDAAAIEKAGNEACGTFLGEVRERRDQLTPAPTETAEKAFTAWAEEAEALGLDCDDGSTDLDDRLSRIDALADRVDAAIGGE